MHSIQRFDQHDFSGLPPVAELGGAPLLVTRAKRRRPASAIPMILDAPQPPRRAALLALQLLRRRREAEHRSSLA